MTDEPATAAFKRRTARQLRRAQIAAIEDAAPLFGVRPTADPISEPGYLGHVEAGRAREAGLLPVEGAVGYDVYIGRPTW